MELRPRPTARVVLRERTQSLPSQPRFLSSCPTSLPADACALPFWSRHRHLQDVFLWFFLFCCQHWLSSLHTGTDFCCYFIFYIPFYSSLMLYDSEWMADTQASGSSSLAPALAWHCRNSSWCKARAFSSLVLNLSIAFTTAKQILFLNPLHVAYRCTTVQFLQIAFSLLLHPTP